MKARNIEITEDTISFDIVHDDDTSFTNVNGAPVRQSIGGWLAKMPDNYTSQNIIEYIDDEMYRCVQDIERRRRSVVSQNRKKEKLAGVKMVSEITMTPSPSIDLYLLENKISGRTHWATDVRYVISGEGEEIVDSQSITTNPFTLTYDNLAGGKYRVTVFATNKRSTVAETVDIEVENKIKVEGEGESLAETEDKIETKDEIQSTATNKDIESNTD